MLISKYGMLLFIDSIYYIRILKYTTLANILTCTQHRGSIVTNVYTCDAVNDGEPRLSFSVKKTSRADTLAKRVRAEPRL